MTVASTPLRRAWVEQIMGLPISVHLRGPDVWSPRVDALVADVFADLRRADDIFSAYRADSQLSRWERGALTLTDADPSLPDVLALCERARQRTGGFFDAWSLPDPIGPGNRLDPSGLVKGWAVQRAAQCLAVLDGHGFCLNAGGDVVVHTPAGQASWRVGIEDPTRVGGLLDVVHVAAGTVATSGTVHRGAHIIDPYRGRPATAVLSVTVIGPSLLWADVYATAAAARGRSALDWLATIDGYEALLVESNRRVGTTPGWPRSEGDRDAGLHMRATSTP